MGQRGKSKLWPVLVAINGALKSPLSPVASGLIELEQCWEQIDHAKETGQIKVDVGAIREALEQAPEEQIAAELRELGMLSGLSVEDLQKIVRRRARRLGLVSDEERVREYCARIAREYMYAEFRGIAQMTTIVSMPLDEVFVPLSAAPEQVTREASAEEQELIEQLERAEDAGERAEVEKRLSEMGARGFLRGAGERAAPMTEVVQRDRKVVVLGDPGSGKTTLVKWLARTCALGSEAMAEKLGWGEDVVPVVVPIGRYGAALEEDASLRLHEHMKRELERDDGEGFGDLMLERMKDGGCLVLLDGLDEIPDAGRRLAAARGVSELVARCPQCRYVVTARIVGYEVCRVSGDVSHYVLRGFADEEIRQFARQWCEAYERASHKEAVDLERARREAAELTEAILDHGHSQVVEFARSPLLLTILALIKQTQVQLPVRRVELYDIALRTLMETWVRGRSLARGAKGVELDVGQSVRAWQRVAYWMHKEKPAGTAHRTELINKLKEALIEEEGLSEKEAEETADSFLAAAAEQTGLLRERGPNTFGFLHQAFEECLAAMHIASPPHTAFERAAPHMHDPRWREVILLTAGYIGAVLRQPELAGGFVDSIRKAGSKYEEILHRDLLLAAECLAERTPVDRMCEQTLVGEVCDLLLTDGVPESSLDELAAALLKMEGMRRALVDEAEERGLRTHSEPRVREASVGLMSRAARDGRGEAEALEDLLSDEDRNVRGRAAAELVARGNTGAKALSGTLIGLGKASGGVRRTILRALRVAQKTETVKQVCLLWLGYDDAKARRAAALALGRLGVPDAEVTRALVRLLKGGDEGDQWAAAEALGELGARNDEVVAALVAALEDGGEHQRFCCNEALGKLGVREDNVVKALCGQAQRGEGMSRLSAIGVLGTLAMREEEVLEAIRASLAHESPLLRSVAVVALAKLGVKDEVVIRTTLACLEDENPLARTGGASAVGLLELRTAGVLATLVRLAREENVFVKLRSVAALGDLGVRGKAIIRALVGALTDEDKSVREEAAQALGKLGPLPEDALERVRGLLGHEDRDVRYWAARVLVQEEERGEA